MTMIELSLLKSVLKVLFLVGASGLRENVLMDEVSLGSAYRPTGDQIREHIRHAESEGFIESRKGLIGETRWSITAKGQAAYKELA